MKLTVLGNNGPFPAAGGACSGYLISDENTNILIDCGNGVLSNLQKLVSFEALDAIILTHLHSDHISDMYVLKYAVQIKRKRGQMNRLMKVYASPEPKPEFESLDVKDAFDIRPISSDLEIKIGNFNISFKEMTHPFKDFGVAIECRGKRFVFSGDTSWNDGIVSFAKDADLLMLDAGLLNRDYAPNSPHLTAEQCGRIAAEANTKALLLTHLWPEYNVNELLEEAGRDDRTQVAQLMREYEI